MVTGQWVRKNARVLVVALLLVALTLASLGTIVDNGFIDLDDGEYITRNGMVKGGLTAQGIRTAFTTTHHTSIWHPITWISHMLDVELFGMKPGAHHAVNLALHTLNALLLFFLLRSLTGTLWRSVIVAAIFAVHPLHVESVAWASERKDVLSTFFLLGATVAYVRAARRNGVAKSVAVPLLFALALMSKAMVVTLPFVLLLLDWWPLARWTPSTAGGIRSLLPPAHFWLEKSPLFALGAGSAVITFFAQKTGILVSSLDTLPLSLRLSNAAVSYARYLGKTVWPRGLTPFYPYPESGLPLAAVAGAVVLLVGVTIFALRFAAKRPYFPVGWFWFLGTLVPVIGFVQTGGQAMADRYTYFTLTGILIAATWGIEGMVARVQGLARPAAILCVALLVSLAVVSRTQAMLWRDDMSLFSHALHVHPGNRVALNVLGNRLLAAGRVEEAIAYYRRAMKGNAPHQDAIHNLGNALSLLGRNTEALPLLQDAVKYRPDFAAANQSLGRTLLQLDRPEEALGPLRTALKLDPADADSHAFLGAAFLALDKPTEAQASLEAAILLNPGNPTAHFNLGLLQLSKNRVAEANLHFERLMTLAPGNPAIHQAIAAVLQARGLREEARAILAASLVLAPDVPETHRKIGNILFEQGRVEESIDHFRKALELNPADSVALGNLGSALARTGKLEEAIAILRRAVAENPAEVDTRVNLGLALLDHQELEEAAYQLLEAYSLDPGNARLTPAFELLVSERGGEDSFTRAALRKPRPEGLPILSRASRDVRPAQLR